MRARKICAVILVVCACILLAGTAWKVATSDDAFVWTSRSATRPAAAPAP